MLPPLRTFLAALWVSSIAGAVVIFGLVMGDYSWRPFIVGAIAGVVIGLPAALLNWAWLRPRRARELTSRL